MRPALLAAPAVRAEAEVGEITSGSRYAPRACARSRAGARDLFASPPRGAHRAAHRGRPGTLRRPAPRSARSARSVPRSELRAVPAPAAPTSRPRPTPVIAPRRSAPATAPPPPAGATRTGSTAAAIRAARRRQVPRRRLALPLLLLLRLLSLWLPGRLGEIPTGGIFCVKPEVSDRLRLRVSPPPSFGHQRERVTGTALGG